MIKKPPGIEDIFPDRIDKWNSLINSSADIFRQHNYREIIIPIMEFTEEFARGIGDEKSRIGLFHLALETQVLLGARNGRGRKSHLTPSLLAGAVGTRRVGLPISRRDGPRPELDLA